MKETNLHHVCDDECLFDINPDELSELLLNHILQVLEEETNTNLDDLYDDFDLQRAAGRAARSEISTNELAAYVRWTAEDLELV
jgi:hypothetical protein